MSYYQVTGKKDIRLKKSSKNSGIYIKANLRHVRFPNSKASYLIAARKAFKNSGSWKLF